MRRAFAAGLFALAAACAEDAPPEAAPESPPAPVKEPVLSLERLELGRTPDGYALAAFGETAGPGWAEPELRPAPRPVAPDGFLVLDFVALPPETPETPEAAAGAARIRADRRFSVTELQGAAGLRVRAVAGRAELAFR